MADTTVRWRALPKVAKELGLSRNGVLMLCRERGVPISKLGNARTSRWLIDVSVLNQTLRERAVTTAESSDPGGRCS